MTQQKKKDVFIPIRIIYIPVCFLKKQLLAINLFLIHSGLFHKCKFMVRNKSERTDITQNVSE